MIENKNTIDIKELTTIFPPKESVLFDLDEFLTAGHITELMELTGNELKKEVNMQWIQLFNALKILDPDKASQIKIPDTFIKAAKKEINKMHEKIGIPGLFEYVALICNVMPEKRNEFLPSTKQWFAAEYHIFETIDEEAWNRFLSLGKDMKIIKPDWNPGIIMNNEIDNLKRFQNKPINFDSLSPFERFVNTRILLPDKRDLFMPDEDSWEELKIHLKNKRNPDLETINQKPFVKNRYLETLADAMILSADDISITAEYGLQLINKPKKKREVLVDIPLPTHRRF